MKIPLAMIPQSIHILFPTRMSHETTYSCPRVQRFWGREGLTSELTVVHAHLQVRRDLLKYPYPFGFFYLVMFLYLRKYFDISKDFAVFLPICCIFLTY